LVGDASKAKTTLGWRYDMPFEDLVREMVESDLARVKEHPEELAAVRSDVLGDRLG